jgi:hypothetical protein
MRHRVPSRVHQIGKGPQSPPFKVVIKVKQQQDIGGMCEKRITDGQNILVLAPDIAQQQPRTRAAQPGVKNGQAQSALRRSWNSAEDQQDQKERGAQAGA